MGKNWKGLPDGGTPGERNFLTDVASTGENPSAGSKLSCFPNPFRDYTTIWIEINQPGKYKLEVYDLQGRLLETLADKVFVSGSYSVDWGSKNSQSEMVKGGIYIIRLSGTSQICNLKVIYLK
jgi:hypothetical protein